MGLMFYHQHKLIGEKRQLIKRLKRALEEANGRAADSLASMTFPKASDTWPDDPVPRIIHQMAKSNVSEWPVQWTVCQKAWKSTFPDFQYRMWTDGDIEGFMRSTYPRYLQMYQSYRYDINRYDFARYLILYEFGGIYADMDIMPLRSFASVLPNGRVSIGESAWKNERFQNALMTSPPRHPFWHYVMSELIAQSARRPPAKFRSVLSMTGPDVINGVSRVVPVDMIHSLPWKLFSSEHNMTFLSSLDTLQVALKDMPKETYAVHLGTCSWC